MTLFEGWELVNYIANKDYEGNVITPERYKQLIKVANIDLLKIRLGLPEDLMPGQPLTRQHLDVNKVLAEGMSFLRVRIPFSGEPTTTWIPTTTGPPLTMGAHVWHYPSNYLMVDTIRSKSTIIVKGEERTVIREVEYLNESRLSDRLSSYIKAPSERYPVYTIRANGLHIYPDTIMNDFEVVYIRYPKTPEFVYSLHAGYITEVETTTTSEPGVITEFEWPVEYHNDLVRIILGYIGINIRDTMLTGYIEQKKREGV